MFDGIGSLRLTCDSTSLAIRAFHSDRARFHDLSTAGFPYLQTHLAFLDDLQYSGLWTITEIPSSYTKQFTTENMGSSSLLSSPANGPSPVDSGAVTPTVGSQSDTISSGRLSPFDSAQVEVTIPRSTAPISLRTYWREQVFPLRQDDLTNLGSKQVQLKFEESLTRSGRSLGRENGSNKTPKRPSRLSRDSTSDMIGDQDDDLESQRGGRTPMNIKEDDKGFPFDDTEDGDTPVNRSPPRGKDGGTRNRAFYVRAVEILIELAELVKVSRAWHLRQSHHSLTQSAPLYLRICKNVDCASRYAVQMYSSFISKRALNTFWQSIRFLI